MIRLILSLLVVVLGQMTFTLAHAIDEEGGTSINVYSESPDRASRIYGQIKLMTPDDQNLFIYNGIKEKELIFTSLPFRYKPDIKWYGNDLVQMTVGTGSPGRFSIFYDLNKDVFSEDIWFVLAFDKKREIAVLGDDRLRVVKVFEDKEIMEIKLKNLPGTAILFHVVEEAKFDAKGNLHLKYQNSKDGESTAIIDSSDMDG